MRTCVGQRAGHTQSTVAPCAGFVAKYRPIGIESRFEALHRSRLSQLVGRDEEIDPLLRCWVRRLADDQLLLRRALADQITDDLAARLKAPAQRGAIIIAASSTT